MDEFILPGINRKVGRPGMAMWSILVMGVVKQGLGCDFDQLHEFVNEHKTLRNFFGHTDCDKKLYHYQTLVDTGRQCEPAEPGAAWEGQLGSVLVKFKPEPHTRKFDHREEVCKCLFVSCGDTAEGSLEATEKSFNLVALPVHFLVEFLRDLAVGLGRDHVNRALLPNHFADPFGVVCLVGQHPLARLQPS